MEDPWLMTSSTDFFLDEKKPLVDSLPILEKLEQILPQFLDQESERMRMSPDSTMPHEVVNNQIQPEAHSIRSNSLSQINDQIPDSTTSDGSPGSDLAYDSDAFNSEDSCSSFAEAQQVSLSHSLAAPSNVNFGLKEEDFNGCNYERLPHRKNVKKAKKAGDSLLKCEVCDYTTRFKEHLTSHMHKHAPDRNYMCQDCGQTFKWSHSLKRHQRTHAPSSDYRYTCHFCLKTFQRKDHLTIHEALHTSSESSFPCAECGATFKNKKTLTGHIKTHNTEKAFKCHQCDSEFTRKASLNRHIRAAHAGHVLTCPLCPAVFSYRNTLEDHKKAAHNQGRRDYSCNLCGVQFAVKAYLSKHMITCRNRDSGISFACTLCSKSFPTKRHLHEHNKRKHPSETEQQSPKQPQRQPQFTSQSPNNTRLSIDQSSNSEPPHQQTQPTAEEQSFSAYDSNYYSYQNPAETGDQYIKNETNNPQLMGHDLPLPQMSEDHNVGSLLRMVYPGCPDQLEQNHNSTAPNVHHEYTQQPNQNTHRQDHHGYTSDMMEFSPAPMPVDFSSLDYL